MNIKDLRYFLAVIELEHFTRAAEQCYVSQPTLSGQIHKLETYLGVQLLERTNRRVVVTEVGKLIAQSARRLLHEADLILEIAKGAQNPMAGPFRLGAIPTLASYLFPQIVSSFKGAMPQLCLILVEEKTERLLEKLRQGEIDAALLALPISDEFLMSEALFKDEFFLAVPPSHELADQQIVDAKKLSHYRFMLLEDGHCLRDQALEVCQQYHINEEQAFKATSLETLREMVKAGTGITLIPKIAIRPDEQEICYIPFKKPSPMRVIGLVWRKTSHRTKVIERLVQLLQYNDIKS